MSTIRSSAHARVQDALKPYIVNIGWSQEMQDDMAEVLLEVLLPLITEQRQLLGVPDGSVLLDRRNTVYKIRNGYLENILTGWRADKNLVEEQGPLVVVAMP